MAACPKCGKHPIKKVKRMWKCKRCGPLVKK